MSFYGRVTNSSKTQFSFDKIYPTRWEMDNQLANNNADGIFVGRYVLVEYGDSTIIPTTKDVDTYIQGYLQSTEERTINGTKYVVGNLYQNTSIEDKSNKLVGTVGQVVIVPVKDTAGENHDLTGVYTSNTYWICTEESATEEGEESKLYWCLISISDSNYTANYEIDKEHYGAGRGYDSTVWTLTFADERYKFVMVAELNSVVPTFDVEADAPTDAPMSPHWSNESTSVYYKLHVQPNWGMRLKKATSPKLYKVDNTTGEINEEVGYLKTTAVNENNLHNGNFFVKTWDKINKKYGSLRQVLLTDEYSDLNLYYTKPTRETMPSDELVVWMRTEYNKETGKLLHYYYTKNDTWQEYDPDTFDSSNTDLYGLGAAIYYNKAGFDPEVSHFSSDENYTINGDEIQFGSTGRSGHDYDSHGEAGNYEADIKELSVMLPSLGDSVAKMWDVVYGDRELNNLDAEGKLTRNMVNRYIRLYLTEAEFNDKINELNNLDTTELSLKRLHYKDKNGNYLQLGSNPSFNANLEYYQLKQVPVRNTNVSWVDGKITTAGGEPNGLRLIHQDDDSWTYNTDEVATVAGAINSVHDLMGMIITEVDTINSIEDVINIDNDAIIYYTGETKKVVLGNGDSLFSDPKYNGNSEPNYTTDTYSVTLEHNHYYIKGNRVRFNELDTDNWQTLSDVTTLYKQVTLTEFSDNLFYKTPKTYINDNGQNQVYYNYYLNSGETVPDSNKIYLKAGYPKMSPSALMPSYSPETYYYKDGDAYKLATSANENKNLTYYSLGDDWMSGDIYTPGCYYIKNGSSWETTFTPAYYFTVDGEERFFPDKVIDFDNKNTYYGINYNDIETNYVKVVGDNGAVTYEQQRTYKINRAQPASLIDYNDENAPVLEASLEDYTYTPLEIATEEDYNKCTNMVNTDGTPVVLYIKNNKNAGQMEVSSSYVAGTTYYTCHWDDNGNWSVENVLDSQGAVPVHQEGYLKNKYFTYRYKPVTIAPTEYAVYSPTQWANAEKSGKTLPTEFETIVDKNKKTWYLVPVDSDFSALCATGKLFKASTEATDYSQVTLTADTYIPNTYFYLYVDGDKETYTLDTSASFNETRTYYQGKMEEQDVNSVFDSSASYFMLAPVLATETKKIKNTQYYRFTELAKLETKTLFDYDDITDGPAVVGRWDKIYTEITIADETAFDKQRDNLYTYNAKQDSYSKVSNKAKYSSTTTYYTCTDSVEDKHYRLKNTIYDKACVSATLTQCNLYEANKYYHKVDGEKIGYELDTTPLGQFETGYVISNEAFNNKQTYYVMNVDGEYTIKSLTQDTYEPGLYYVAQSVYSNYYTCTEADQALLTDGTEFYQAGEYYYKVDDAYYIDNNKEFNTSRTYYKITPTYVIQDDLNAYSRGAAWNINILPVPNTVHIGTREEKTTLRELEGFGRTYNTINGLIVKIRQLIGTDEGENRETDTILGAAQKIRDIVAQFGAMKPSQALVVDGYGRVRSAESNCEQIDEIKNYGEADPVAQQLNSTGQVIEADSLAEPDRRIKDRWINITLPIYNYKGRMYTDYDSLEAVIENDKPQFAYSLNDTIVRYYYQWTPETDADFEKAKESLYTATTGEANGIYTVLTNVKAVDEDSKFGTEGVEYWYYLADQAIDASVLESDNWSNVLWTGKEARHHLVGNKAEFQVTHTFLAQEDTTTSADKNCESTDKTEENKGSGINASEDDTLQLYTPIVDSKGHVVAHNEETVTLPYGFKYLKTNGAETEANSDLFTSGAKNVDGETNAETKAIQSSESKATTTKDLVQINSGNKWVQVGIENNTITLDHEIHNIDRTAITSDFNADSENIVDTITVQDTEYDNAGHAIENHKHTYTLPYSFKKIEGSNTGDDIRSNATAETGETKVIADNTQDTLTIAASNKWVHIDTATTEDTVYIGHETHTPELSNKNETDINGNGDIITIQDIAFDEAGHMISNQSHPYRLPYGFKTIHGANSNSVETGANDVSNDQVADNTQDTLTIAASNKWIRIDTATEDTVQLGHEVHEIDTAKADDTDINGNGNTITIQDTAYDEAGHLVSNKLHTYILPFGYKVISDGTTASTAQNTQDTFTITGDTWVKPTVAQGRLSLTHLAANTTGTQAYRTDDKPALGGTFQVPTYSFDTNGHIYESSTYSITLPSLELTTSRSKNKAELVTGLAYATNGTEISYTTQNLSSMLLTGYSSTLDTPIVEGANSLAEGLQALENSIHANSVSINTNAEDIKTNSDNITANAEAIQATAHSIQFSYDSETGILTANVFDGEGKELESTNNTIILTDLFYTKAEIDALLNPTPDTDTDTTE